MGSMQIQIGSCANLLSGLSHNWNPSTGDLELAHSLDKAALAKNPVRSLSILGNWSDLKVTLHESPEDLLSAVVPFEVNHPSSEGTPPSIPVGALFLGRKDSQAAADALSNTLGVPLSPDYSYAFVRVRRVDGEQLDISRQNGVLKNQANLKSSTAIADNEFENDLRSLPRVAGLTLVDQMAKLTANNATMYLDFFKKWGTHFISRVQLGDQIMQVFAYSKSKFDIVKQNLSAADIETTMVGDTAKSFVQFTTDASKGRFGFVDKYGNLMSMSNDSVFADSLSEGKWVENLWSEGNNSIFNAYANTTSLPWYKFDGTFKKQAVLYTEVSPLTVYCEYERAEIWRRVFKAAAATVFLDTVDANFSDLDTRNFASIIPDDQPGVLSALPTPNVNVYKARLDLSSVQLVAANAVKNFTGCAYVASTKGVVNVPGDNVQLFAGVIDARSTGNANVLTVTDSAFDSMSISCGKFLGIIRVENTIGNKYNVICDGLSYSLDSKGLPKICNDVRVAAALPDSTLVSLLDNFRFALTFGDAVLGAQQSTTDGQEPAIYTIVRDYLTWMANVISPGAQDESLLQIRVRALILGSYKADSSVGAFVPILPSEAYEDHINKMMDYTTVIEKSIKDIANQIEARREEEKLINVAATLNKNIIDTGKLLSGFIDASAAQQADIASSFDSVIEQQKSEAKNQEASIDKLSAGVHSSQSDFEFQSQKFRSKLKQFEAVSAVKAGLDIATAVFSLGTGVLIPSETITAVESLGSAAQKIQKVFNVLNGLKTLYDASTTGLAPLKASQTVLDELDGSSFGDMSSLPWDEMQLQFENVIAKVPLDSFLTGPKADLITAFKTLTLRAKALTSARAQLQQIQRSIYENQMQKELNKSQQKRLDVLTSQFSTENVENLDISSIDLVGMTAMLNYRRDQVLSSLSRAFLIADEALQYETLQTPTRISSYSLLNFLQARSTQSKKYLDAKAALAASQPTTTSPIIFEVPNIPIADVTNGEKRHISISPASAQFKDYVYVRVKAVMLSVDGVATTDSGKVSVRLQYDESPFVDRDLNGNILTFHTPERERIYEYKLDGTPLFTDNGSTWSEGVSDVTPFGGWYVDFPKLNANSGIQFISTHVSVKLSFVLETRIRSENDFAAFFVAPRSMPQRPSETTVIRDFHNAGTVTNGWDVVFNMETSAINTALETQYNDLKNNPDFNNVINAQTSTTVADETTYTIELRAAKYGPPETVNTGQFLPQLQLRLTEGSLIQTTRLGDQQSEPNQIDVKGLVLGVDINPVNAADSAYLEYKLGEGIFSWFQITPSNGKYDLNGHEVDEDDMNLLFADIKSFFDSTETSYLVPKAALLSNDYDAMNTALSQQYNDIIMNTDFKNSIIASSTKITPATISITRIHLIYSYPLMSFDANNSEDASLEITILSGSSTKFVKVGDEPEKQSGQVVSLENKLMEATVKLKKVRGKAENNHDELRVELDMGEGAFKISEIQLAPTESIALSQQIKAHFVENSTVYLINKLDLSEASVGRSLLPSGFLIKLLVTPSRVEILQLYIQTDNRALKGFTQAFLNNAPEPLPVGSQSSIIVRSELFFGSILPSSLSANEWRAQGNPVNSSIASSAWKASFTNAMVSATGIDLSSLTRSVSAGNGTTIFEYSLEGNRIDWNLGSTGSDALALTPQPDGSLKLSGSKSEDVNVQEKITTIVPFSTTISHNQITTTARSDVTGTMRISVDDGGRDQQVTAAMNNQGLEITGHLSGGGACGCDNLEAQVNQNLREKAPPQIREQLDFSMAPVSTFAVKNLLFYKTNYINLETASGPGDLVLFGNFTN